MLTVNMQSEILLCPCKYNNLERTIDAAMGFVGFCSVLLLQFFNLKFHRATFEAVNAQML